MKLGRHFFLTILASFALSSFDDQFSSVFGQGTTAFTYQGQLRDGGTNANGTYTMTFKLYDAASGGSQKGGTMINSPTLANGLFSVNLDFGSDAFNGAARWLDITVQSGSDIETLTPRIQVLPTPYAIFANIANTASNLIGTVPSSQLGGVYSNMLTLNSSLNQIIGTFTGNGSGLANVNAALLGGLSKSSFALLTDLANYATLDDLALATSASILHGITNYDVSTNFDAPAVYTFTVPAGVTQLYIEAWGGGGGGGGYGLSDSGGYSPGTGGAGGYARGYINVTPLQDYIVQVGNAGANGTSAADFNEDGTDGADGGDSLIETIPDSQVLFLCTGGAGGEGGTQLYGDGAGGEGGQADSSAAIQRPGSPGIDGNSSYYYYGPYNGGLGTLGSLQPNLPISYISVYYSVLPVTISYGSGGSVSYPNAATGGCIIIQW